MTGDEFATWMVENGLTTPEALERAAATRSRR
jgi:hypothetical protein